MVYASAQATSVDSNWNRLKTLPAHARVHVAADHKSQVCWIEQVNEATLQCSKGHAQYSFERAEVKSVKLARYTRSTLAGLGIGLVAGMGVGAIAGHGSQPANSYFGSGLGTDAGILIGGAAGLIAGGAIGGPTDFLRGPTIYRRP